MDTYSMIQKEHQTIRNVLDSLKEELVNLVRDERVDKMIWSMGLAFIQDSVMEFHHGKEREILLGYKLLGEYEDYYKMLEQILRYHELIPFCYTQVLQYWHLYQEGYSLARFEVMDYGERMIHLLNRSMKLEEKLFGLTTRECIVK